MKRAISILLLSTACLLAATGCEDNNDLVGFAIGRVFSVVMTGSNERPNPVSPSGTGSVTLTLDDAKTISYTITVANMTSAITAAHIHLGDENTAGGIILLLTTPVNGQMVTGTITRTTPLGLGLSFETLLDLMLNGDAYINVHTANNPNGEIRGQIEQVLP